MDIHTTIPHPDNRRQTKPRHDARSAQIAALERSAAEIEKTSPETAERMRQRAREIRDGRALYTHPPHPAA